MCSSVSFLYDQWDQGQYSAARYALFTAQSLYGEPIINALWAFMAGWKTHEDIFDGWEVIWDKGDEFGKTDETAGEAFYNAPYIKVDADGHASEILAEHSYAYMSLPTQWLSADSYKEYLEWTDLYAYGEEGRGSGGMYNYPEITASLSDYTSKLASVPAYYQDYPAAR